MRIIASGLETDERVIIKGLQRVRPGQKVEAEVAQATLATTVRKPVVKPRPLRTRQVATPAAATPERASARER